tara:strand:- start:259 stop:564 length:306 start_codon:yes stop_codon:yes gene_type:complete
MVAQPPGVNGAFTRQMKGLDSAPKNIEEISLMTDAQKADWVRQTYGIDVTAEMIAEPARISAANSVVVRKLATRLALETEPTDYLRELEALAPRTTGSGNK